MVKHYRQDLDNNHSIFATSPRWTIEGYEWPNLSGLKHVAFDTETTGRDIYGKSTVVGWSFYSPEFGRSVYMPIDHLQGGNLPMDKAIEWAKDNFRGKTLRMTEATFDIEGMRKLGVDFEQMDCEVQNIQFDCALLDSRRQSYQLDSMAYTYLGKRKVVLPKDVMKIHERLPEVVDWYARYDAELTWELGDYFEPRIEAEKLGRVRKLEYDLIYSTCHMQRNGLRLDLQKLIQYQRTCRARYQRIVLDLEKMVGFRVIPNKREDMVRLFKHLGLELKYTEEGNPSFRVEDLNYYWHPKYCHGSPVEPVKLLTQGIQLASLDAKVFTKYLEAVDDDGIIRFKLHQLKADKDSEDGGQAGTVTGRYSTSGSKGEDGGRKGFNPQQVWKAEEQAEVAIISDLLAKDLFIGTEQFPLVISADASQIEYRIFGHYANSPSVTEVYRKNPWADFHVLVSEMTGIPRKDAKHANFAKLFGAGVRKFAYMIDKAESEARPIFDEYSRRFPEADRLLREASDLAKSRGWVKTLLERRRRYGPGIDEKYYSAINAVIQGTAADINKMTVLDVYNNMKDLNIDLRLTFHDEEIMFGRMETSKECERLYDFFNQQRIQLRVPILWNLVVGDSWSFRNPLWHREKGIQKADRFGELDGIPGSR